MRKNKNKIAFFFLSFCSYLYNLIVRYNLLTIIYTRKKYKFLKLKLTHYRSFSLMSKTKILTNYPVPKKLKLEIKYIKKSKNKKIKTASSHLILCQLN